MARYGTPACRHENGEKTDLKSTSFSLKVVFWAGGFAGPSQFGMETGAMYAPTRGPS